MTKLNVLAVALSCILGILTLPVQATTIYWTGSQSTGNWSTVNTGLSNWSTDAAGTVNYGQAPQNGDDLNFNATNATLLTTTNDMVGLVVNSVTFINASFTGPVTINGNSFTISPSTTTVGITNTNATASRNVTLAAPIVIGAAQTWTASVTNAITILNGNLSGSANVVVSGNGSNSTTLPNIRLGGSNSAFTGTLDSSASSSGVLLANAAAMTGGLINISGTNANLWLTANSAASPYTMGLSNTAGSPNVITRNAGTSGVYLTGGDIYWDPGNGGDYAWTNNTNPELRIDGSNDTTPRMLHFGNTTGNLILSGGNRAIAGGTGGNNPGRVNVLFALADDTQATARVFSATVNLLILNRPAVNNVTGATKSSITIGTGTSGSTGLLAVSDLSQLFAGNLNINTGTLLLDNISWATLIGARSIGTGNAQFQLSSTGGFAARTADVTIDATGTTTSTFDRTLTLGSGVLSNDGSQYANKTVFLARDTTLSAGRTINVPNNGTAFGITPTVLNKISGNLSGAGSVTVTGVTNSTTNGELVLSGSNTWTGGVSPAINGAANTFNSGPGGMNVSFAFVRFDGAGSLPSGNGGSLAYLGAVQRNNSAQMGFLLVGGASPVTYALPANMKFMIGGMGGAENVGTLGADGGATVLQNSSVLIHNGTSATAHSLNLFVRGNSSLALGSSGNPARFIPSTGTSGAASTTATAVSDATGTRTFTKRGDGTLVIGNVAYTNVAESGNTAAQFLWQIGRGTGGNNGANAYSDGAVRGLAFSDAVATDANSLKNFFLQLRGGVYEIDNSGGGSGTFNATLGTSGAGKVSIGNVSGTTPIGGGGFAAYGGNVVIDLNNLGTRDTLTWSVSSSGFLQTNDSLLLGSQTATHTVEVFDNIALAGAVREIRVFKNVNASTDKGLISGVLSGTTSSGITKTGPGVLDLSGTNTYNGTTTVSAGTLLISANAPSAANGALGNASTAALVGDTSGALDAALLTNGAFTVGRAITVQAGNTGTITLGGNTADNSTFSGAMALNKNATFTATSGGTVNVTGAISGNGAVTKTGAGIVVMTNTNSYSGATSVSAGTLAGTATLSTSSLTVSSGAIVAPGTPGGATGTFTAAGANFSGGGALTLRATSPTTFDQLNVTNAGNTATLTMGGTSVLNIDLNGFTGSGEFVMAQANAWSVGAPFTTVNIMNAGGNTARISYKNVNATTKQVLLAVNQAVSPVKIADFSARSEAFGANVSWTAVSEYQNAGFNIYRRALDRSEWVKANPVLISGRITHADEKKYAYFDWVAAGMYEYRLESVALSGGRDVYENHTGIVAVDALSVYSQDIDIPVETVASALRSVDMAASAENAQHVEAVFAARRTASVSPTPTVAPTIQFSSHHAMPVGARSTSSVSNTPGPQQPVAGIRWFSSSNSIGASTSYSAAKVMYKDAGVLLISQSSLPAGFDLNHMSLQREGRSIKPLAKVRDGLLIYAPGYKDEYTDKDAIFLRNSDAATTTGSASTASGLFSTLMPVDATTATTVTQEYHDVYFDYSSTLRPFVFEPWFSSHYLTQGSTQDFTVNLPGVVSGSANLVLKIWSLTSDERVSPDHGIQVLVNGQAVGETRWDGGGAMLQVSFAIPADALKSGDNVVSLITPTIAGLDSQIAFLHSIRVSYTRALDGSKPIEIIHSTSAPRVYELSNASPMGTWVVDARYPDRATLVATESMVQADGSWRVRFVAAAGGSGKYLVVPVGSELSPVSISARLVKPLKLNGTYLATGPAQFAAGVQALLMKRSKEGIRSAFVDQEQLFDYYNDGRFGPEGIRKAVRSVHPGFLLLVGRTTYDYLNYSGANVDPLCPAFLVSTHFWAQTTSDSAFGDLGRGYPEVAVGRLPVNTTSELEGAVSHIVNHSGMPASGIRLHAVADKADALVADFGAQLDTMVKASNPDIFWQENYLGKTHATAPDVTVAMKDAANGGADLILYSGHGSAARLGATAPNILDQTSVREWTGNTVFLQATCTANWMAKNEQDYKSIAIQALTQAQGGIAASIGTSTYMNPDVATAFMNQLLKNTSGTGVRWGEALLKTQQWAGAQAGNAFYKDLMTTEHLFGDPAMPVYTPKRSAPLRSVLSTAPGTF